MASYYKTSCAMNKASDITEDACWLLPKVTDFSRTFDILTHYCRSPSSFSLSRLLAGSNFTIYATIQRVNMVRVYSCVTLQTNKLKGHFSSAGMRKKDTLLGGPSKKKKNMKAVLIASLNRPVCFMIWHSSFSLGHQHFIGQYRGQRDRKLRRKTVRALKAL